MVQINMKYMIDVRLDKNQLPFELRVHREGLVSVAILLNSRIF